jgi:hypothetical protein
MKKKAGLHCSLAFPDNPRIKSAKISSLGTVKSIRGPEDYFLRLVNTE